MVYIIKRGKYLKKECNISEIGIQTRNVKTHHTHTHARTELRPTLDGKGHLEYNKLSILINRTTDNTFSIRVSLDFKDLDIL